MKRHRFHPFEALAALGRRLLRSAALVASTKTEICGLEVLNADRSEDSERLFEQLRKALELIQDVDGRVLAQVRRDLRRIVIVGYRGSSYWPELGACALSRSTLESQRPEWVASVVVHEACHGRLQRLGITYRPALRPRIERICAGAQDRFLEKLPGTEALREHLAAQMEQGHGATNESLARRAAQLESLGVPKWLARRF